MTLRMQTQSSMVMEPQQSNYWWLDDQKHLTTLSYHIAIHVKMALKGIDTFKYLPPWFDSVVVDSNRFWCRMTAIIPAIDCITVTRV